MKDGIMQIRLADILQPYCRCFRQNAASICSHTDGAERFLRAGLFIYPHFSFRRRGR